MCSMKGNLKRDAVDHTTQLRIRRQASGAKATGPPDAKSRENMHKSFQETGAFQEIPHETMWCESCGYVHQPILLRVFLSGWRWRGHNGRGRGWQGT